MEDTPPIKYRGAGLILYHRPTNAYLFFLRDDKPRIPFPGMLDIIGGRVEEGETSEEGMLREWAEEIEDTSTGEPYQPTGHRLFKQYVDDRQVEQNIFVSEIDGQRPNLRTSEGQGLVWLTPSEIDARDFGYGYKDLILDYVGAN